jgi:hypothetical protein
MVITLLADYVAGAPANGCCDCPKDPVANAPASEAR